MKKLIFVAVLFLLNTPLIFSNNISIADSLRNEGIKLMNSGKFEKSLKLLQEASRIDTENIILKYEIALVYYKLNNYDKTIEILLPLKDNPDAFEQIYQLLGNSYDFTANKREAFKIYNEGLNKFPNSGRLYMEMGIAEIGNDNYALAVKFFEKGTTVEYDYPNNYYHLAEYYYDRNNYVYALLYYETFMNYVRNENKFREVNKLIYNIYNNLFVFENNKAKDLNNNIIHSRRNFINDYSDVIISAYNELYNSAKDSLTIGEISELRTVFISKWYSRHPESFPNSLFSHQKKLIEKDLFEAYNYWMMSEGNPEEFKSWIIQDFKKYDDLLQYLSENKLFLTSYLDLLPRQ